MKVSTLFIRIYCVLVKSALTTQVCLSTRYCGKLLLEYQRHGRHGPAMKEISV